MLAKRAEAARIDTQAVASGFASPRLVEGADRPGVVGPTCSIGQRSASTTAPPSQVHDRDSMRSDADCMPKPEQDQLHVLEQPRLVDVQFERAVDESAIGGEKAAEQMLLRGQAGGEGFVAEPALARLRCGRTR